MEETARDIVALKKTYNLREGWKPEDDALPARFLETPLPDGASAGACLDAATLDSMIRAYYSRRGWSEDGRPPPQRTQGLLRVHAEGEQ